MNKKSILLVVAWALCLLPTGAFAHHAEWMTGHPFVQGLSMPIHGLDHMLVTFVVGLIAAQMGGAALWVLPCAFSLLLLLGGTLNVCGVSLPIAEQAISASMIVVGGLLSFHGRKSLLVTLAIVGAAATFHGNVLIGEAPHDSWFFFFALGCLIAAFALQAAGMWTGWLISKFAQKQVFRYAGWATVGIAALIYAFPGLNTVVIHLLE
jgi:urease accessory protein